jgi:NhaA family Na+:H+ antiporter
MSRMRSGLSAVRAFLRLEAAAGGALVLAAVIALAWSNSPYADWYAWLRHVHASVRVGEYGIDEPLLLWIDDGLMAVFFLLIGLEIKRELLQGELSSLRKAALPAIAAAGGMLAPALIYVAANHANPQALRGWAIPTATDIAFAAGALSLLGSRVPRSLRTFLLALAIFDDLGAIGIIALVYSGDLNPTALLLAGACILGLIMLNRMGVTRIAPYMLLGIALWVCVLESAVHATLAGVALACTVPLRMTGSGASPLHRLERALHPYVTWGIVPLFALANGGVDLRGMSAADLLGPLSLGVALGLLVGKPAGVMAASWLAVRLRVASLPQGATWRGFHGIAALAGIGFTMSLFIAALAFDSATPGDEARVGILAGSLLSGILGLLLLRRAG